MANDEVFIEVDNIDFLHFGGVKSRERKKPKTTMIGRRKKHTVMERAYSESMLAEVLPHNLHEDYSYHVISGGNVDSLSYLKHIIKSQDLDYCLMSTWCMAMDDIEQIREWLEKGKIKRFDSYVGEIFKGSYSREYASLVELHRDHGGRVAIFRNHSKIFAGTGEKYSFAIESSANVNTNPRTENTTIHTDNELFLFYKEFYDGIVSFSKNFQDWKKWSIKNGKN